MKNDPSSSYRLATSALSRAVNFVPVRHTVIALFVAGTLSSCAAIKELPEKIGSYPEKMKLEIPGNTSDFRNRLYAGGSMGNSSLSPNTRGERYSVDSSSDIGTQLRLGYDVHNLLAVEVDTTVLGESSLSASNPNRPDGTVKYSSAAISALIYGWSGVQMRSRREGLSAYGRFGFSSLKKSSVISGMQDSGVVPILGLGAEYGFTNGLGIRAEITRFDSDATYVGFGAVYRFGISPTGIGQMIAQAAEPALGGARPKIVENTGFVGPETVVERYAGPNARPANGAAPHVRYNSGAEPNAKYVGSMADRWRPAMRSDDRDVDGVLDNADSCPDTDRFVTVDRYGCGLFDAVLHEVTFKSASHWLTPRARKQLDLLADTLLAFPEARIQVRAHTDSRGAADMNLGLSSLRAEAVVLYLQSRGVNELQLQAVGVGEAQPLDTNKTSTGRKRNRRVDIVTLPDQDAGQLLVAVNVQSNTVMTVQATPNPHPPSSEMMASNDDWNSASKHTKRKAKKPGVSPKTSIAPALLAAKPAGNAPSAAPGPMGQGRPDINRVNAAVVVAPLPQPGFAPNFPFTGVLSGVRFARGEIELGQESQAALLPLLDALKRDSSVKIAIMAHTDNQGVIQKNKVLSTKRAEAVVKHLIDGGIAAERLKAEGYGELLPLVQNVTDADRERNRRIEVRVLP